ncbi:PTR2-domain-containing protein [Penicillium canescens]|uniref:PTR2-domain-containing protein n=1 Tax=Penicillium canescens TaxID=5083 RepID=A0AAD6IIP6_PENCN|nr:PTR2-domain-containing protein [Penicillium canescens]KAJ6050794.1 PTR2-domain-containing protein [Penicillium canescens]KAJ6183564.1 PTR2-domain-containing protein [Penicillium canescens]
MLLGRSVNNGGIDSVASNQRASTVTNGAPRDVLNKFIALTIIVAIPIPTFGIYPMLNRYRI